MNNLFHELNVDEQMELSAGQHVAVSLTETIRPPKEATTGFWGSFIQAATDIASGYAKESQSTYGYGKN